MESDSLFSDIRVELRDPYSGEIFRADRKYAGYVPGLACPRHGGPEKPKELDDGQA